MSERLIRALALARGQRHSFMNHLQVISGWLQLGKAERATEYIARMAARMEAESQVLQRIEHPEVGLFVVAAGLDAEPYGASLEWRLTGPVDLAGLDPARDLIQAELQRAARQPEGQRRLIITLGTPITVHTPSVQGEG